MTVSVIPRFIPETRALDIAASLLTWTCVREPSAQAKTKRELCAICGCDDAILTPSARAGLYWILRTLRPPQVYLPAFLCSSVYECVLRAGIPMTYLDVKPNSFEVDYGEHVYEAGSVLLLVHQYGIPANPEEARAVADTNNLILVEDIAASLGATWKGRPVGSFGDAAIASFEFSKTISACKGGAALFRDSDLYERVLNTIQKARAGHELGRRTPWFTHALAGVLYDFLLWPPVYGAITLPVFRVRNGPFVDRSKTIKHGGAYQADFATGRARLVNRMLSRLPQIAERRRQIGEMYRKDLANVMDITLADMRPEVSPVFTHYPILLQSGFRELVVRDLWHSGVDPGFNFSYLCGGEVAAESAPRSLDYTGRIITLPVSARLSDEQVHQIADSLRMAVDRARSACAAV